MSTNCQPSSHGTVQRKKMEAAWSTLPREHHILQPIRVDRGDRLHGYYYRCRSTSRNFYKYIFFLFDVAITNAYILIKCSGRPCPFKDFRSFWLQLAKELIGEYCSHCHRGHGAVVHPHPFRHFPIRLDNDNRPRHPWGGPCALQCDTHHRRVLSPWYYRECGEWLVTHQTTVSCSDTYNYMFDFMWTSFSCCPYLWSVHYSLY